MNKRIVAVLSTGLFVLLLVLSAPEASARTGRRSRQGNWDVYLAWQRLGGDSTDITMKYEGVDGIPAERKDGTLKLNSTHTYGLGVGYNITDNFNVNANFLFGSMRMETRGFDEPFDRYMESRDSHDLLMGDLNLDYYFLRDTFTPLLTGGIGLMDVRGDFDDLDKKVDYDVEGTLFSYNVGVGFRWDITERVMLKCIYRNTWTKLNNTDDRVQMEGWGINLGFMF